LNSLNLAEARDGLKKKSFSALELADAHLAAMEKARALNAYVLETPERAFAMAKASDARIAAGKAGPLEGIPLAIKDMFCTEGVRSTACSHILDNFMPTYDSTVTANLWRDGAVLLGKTNNDEFAMGSSNETSHFGPVISPWRRTRTRACPSSALQTSESRVDPTFDGANTPLTPGGSSGGSAAAVAAQLCLGATGTDTGGSIRQPAAFTGTVGIKPTYGRCSRWGIVAFASSLDQAGPFARTVRDAAILLRSMAGPDAKDTTCADLPVPEYEAAVGKSVKGLRIGIPKEYRLDGMPAEIEKIWQQGRDWLKAAGAELVEVSLPHTKYALPAYYIVNPAEASSNLARYDGVRYGLRVPARDIIDMYEGTRSAGFGAEVRRRVMIGTYVLSAGYYDAYYLRAQKVRTLISQDFANCFNAGVHAMLTPATPSAAFGLGEKGQADPVEMYLNDVFTVTVNMAGLPGIAVPAGLDGQGLPLGLQLIGRPFDEETLFAAAAVIEQAAGPFTPPTWW
jgi:aspartyl-tRNA(Asn)/glutamyl-tRNA(Gln) amidotransferase subunit A